MPLQKIGVEAVVDNLDGYKRAVKAIESANDSATESVNRTAKQFDVLGTATKGIGNIFENVFTGVITGVVLRALDTVFNAIGNIIGAIGNLGKNIFDAGVTFSGTMANISSITRLTGQDLTNLGKDLIEIGADTAAGPQAVAEAYYEVASGVADASIRLDILKAAVATAEAGQANLTATTAGLIASVNAYSSVVDENGKRVLDAAEASDIYTRTVALGVGSMDQFVHAMSPLAGLAASQKISFEELGGAMAFMTAKGIPAEQAATAIKNAIVQLSRESPGVIRALKAMGEKSIESSIATRGFAGTLTLLQEGAKKTGQNFTTMIGSVEALQAATALGGEEFQKFFDEFIDGVDGATAAARELQRADVSFQLKLIGSRFQAIGLSISQAVLPAFNKFLTFINDSFKKFDWKKIGEGLDKLGEKLGKSVGRMIDQLGAALEQVDWDAFAQSISDAFSSIGDFIAGIDWESVGKSIGDTFSLIADIVSNINWEDVIDQAFRFFDAMGQVVTGVMGFFMDLGQGIGTFVSGWNSFWNQVGTAVNTAMSDAQNFISGATAPIQGFIQGIIDAVKPIWDGFFTAAGTAASGVSTAFEMVKTLITDFIEPIKGALQPMIDTLGNLWNSLFGEGGLIPLAVSTAYEAVKTNIDNALAPVRDTVQSIIDALSLVWAPFWDGLSGKVTAAWEAVKAAVDLAKAGVTAAFKLISDGIVSALQPVLGAIDSIKSFLGGGAGGAGGGGGGGGFAGVGVGGAVGGDMSEGLNIVGERGLEAVWKAGSKVTIFTASQTKRILSGVGNIIPNPNPQTAKIGSIMNSIGGGRSGWSGINLVSLMQSLLPVPVPIMAGMGDSFSSSINNSRNYGDVNFNSVSNGERAVEKFARLRATGRL